MSFALSLFIVTFLHLVVGEMAPKSGLPTGDRGARHRSGRALFITHLAAPVIGSTVAYALVRRAGEDPVERAAARG